jgi:hypothetical protein
MSSTHFLNNNASAVLSGLLTYCDRMMDFGCKESSTLECWHFYREYNCRPDGAKAQEFAKNIFEQLKAAAAEGKTEVSLRREINMIGFGKDPQASVTAAVSMFGALSYLKDRMSLSIPDLKVNEGTHSIFCGYLLGKGLGGGVLYVNTPIKVSWEKTNPFLYDFPKPTYVAPLTSLFGVEALNEERKAGKGDCELEFSIQKEVVKFSAHRYIVERFSPVFKTEFAQIDTLKKPQALEFATPEGFRKEEIEALINFMYIQKLDLSRFKPTVAIRFLQWSTTLQSEALREVSLKHLYSIADTLSIEDIHEVFFLLADKELAPRIQPICEWLFLKLSTESKKTVIDSIIKSDFSDLKKVTLDLIEKTSTNEEKTKLRPLLDQLRAADASSSSSLSSAAAAAAASP